MKKLLVFMIDALCSSDLEKMREMDNFSKIIDSGSYVRFMKPVHPALTYCCHVSIVTGRYVDGHGITNNEYLRRGCKSTDVWFGKKEEIKVPTFLDKAMELGLSTCSLSWPVSAGADYSLNFPMIVPYRYNGFNPEQYLYGYTTDSIMENYWWKFGRYMKGPDHNLDSFTMALAPEIIKDYGQPDIMLVKMCDLDSYRHTYGVYHERAYQQLQKHDEELGVLLESIRRYGDYDNTNFVIIGDHGQTDIEDVLNMNKLFEQNGFIKANEKGEIVSADCYAHSAALTCFVEIADPEDERLEKRVRAFLESLKDDPDIQLDYVYDKKEMKEKFHLEGPFDFVIESRRNISFGFDTDMSIPTCWRSRLPGDHVIGAATHGGNPDRAEQTLFIASGPSVKRGVVIESASLVDEAVTMARMVGFDFEGTDGKLLEELLADN